MARISYLMRREGRYYVQARLAPHVAAFAGRSLYRASLRTADYRRARQRLVECMTWVVRMNDTIDYVSLFQKNVVQLSARQLDSLMGRLSRIATAEDSLRAYTVPENALPRCRIHGGAPVADGARYWLL